MKNVQCIDSALNCTFSVFQFTDEQSKIIFPNEGQDIAFSDDFEKYLTPEQSRMAFDGAWERPMWKQDIIGLHGTIFFAMPERMACFPASRRESDWIDSAINAAQRRLHEAIRQKLSQ